jgi:hypothetical protein
MNDPKYKYIDGKIWHIGNKYFVPDDEPVMTLRGKDIGAIIAICEYIDMLRFQPQNKTIVDHLNSSYERLQSFYDYQMSNPDLQSIGCTRKSHTGYKSFLIMAEKVLLTKKGE